MTTNPPADLAGPPGSKTEYVLDRLRKEIVGGVITAGESLRQTDLATRYGVSPTPVREALRLLEAEGVILYSPHRGATVTELTPERVHDLYLLRASVESLATQLAVERLEGRSVDDVVHAHERISQAVGTASGRQLGEWNRDFHQAIYALGSSLVASHITLLWRQFPTRVTVWEDEAAAALFVSEHERIVAAVVDGDAQQAADVMSEHILTAARFRQESDVVAGDTAR